MPKWGGGRAFFVTGPPDAMNATALLELKMLLPAAINATDDSNHQPLNMAAYWGNLDAVRALLEAGADVSHGDINYHKPLHHAVYSDAPEPVISTIIGLLLQAGASPTAKDRFGKSAYDIALRRTQGRKGRRFLVLHALDSSAWLWPGCASGARYCVLFVGCEGCEHNVSSVAETLMPRLAARNVGVRYVTVEDAIDTDLLRRSDGLSAVMIYLDHRTPRRVEAPLLAQLESLTKKGVWVIAMHGTVAAFPHRTADTWGQFLGGRYRGNARRRWCCSVITSTVTSIALSVAPFFTTIPVTGYEEEYILELVEPAGSRVTILETVTHRASVPIPWSWIRHPVALGEAGVLFMCWGDRLFKHESETNAVDTSAFADRLSAAIAWAAENPGLDSGISRRARRKALISG